MRKYKKFSQSGFFIFRIGLKSALGISIIHYLNESCVSKESVKENCPGKESSDLGEDNSKIGNTLWCFGGKYKPMATHAESICCSDKYEIRKSYCKGILSFVFEILLSSNLLVRRK